MRIIFSIFICTLVRAQPIKMICNFNGKTFLCDQFNRNDTHLYIKLEWVNWIRNKLTSINKIRNFRFFQKRQTYANICRTYQSCMCAKLSLKVSRKFATHLKLTRQTFIIQLETCFYETESETKFGFLGCVQIFKIFFVFVKIWKASTVLIQHQQFVANENVLN